MANIPPSFQAVLSALKFCSPDRRSLQKLRDSEWTELLLFCDRMHLTIPLGRTCPDDLPDSVRSRINQNISDNTERFERIKTVYSQVAAALHHADVNHVV